MDGTYGTYGTYGGDAELIWAGRFTMPGPAQCHHTESGYGIRPVRGASDPISDRPPRTVVECESRDGTVSCEVASCPERGLRCKPVRNRLLLSSSGR